MKVMQWLLLTIGLTIGGWIFNNSPRELYLTAWSFSWGMFIAHLLWVKS